jgi:hypothetical protein
MKATIPMIHSVIKASMLVLASIGVVFLVLLGALARSVSPSVSEPPTFFHSFGPTITQLESMSKLATTRVHITDVLTGEGEGYRGSWLIKEDALLSCDLSRAVILRRDNETRTAVIRLPRLRVRSPRLDHEKSKVWSVEKATWLPWKWGNQDLFRDEADFHAQKLVETAAGSEETLGPARARVEFTL